MLIISSGPRCLRLHVESLAVAHHWSARAKEQRFFPVNSFRTFNRGCAHIANRHLYWNPDPTDKSDDSVDASDAKWLYPVGESVPCMPREHQEHATEELYSRLRSCFASRNMSVPDHEFAVRTDNAKMAARTRKKRHLPIDTDALANDMCSRKTWLEVDASALQVAAHLFARCLVKKVRV